MSPLCCVSVVRYLSLSFPLADDHMAFVSFSPTISSGRVNIGIPSWQECSDRRRLGPLSHSVKPFHPTTIAGGAIHSAATTAAAADTKKASGWGASPRISVDLGRGGRGGGGGGGGLLQRKNRVKGTDNPHSRLFVKKVQYHLILLLQLCDVCTYTAVERTYSRYPREYTPHRDIAYKTSGRV